MTAPLDGSAWHGLGQLLLGHSSSNKPIAAALTARKISRANTIIKASRK
jgi:hypothetical protein